MYNPHQLNECEREKARNPRPAIDALMTAIGVLASLSSVPQALKIWSTGVVAGISLTTEALALGAVLAWFLYGLYIRNKPLVVTSALSAIVLGTVIAQILWYR